MPDKVIISVAYNTTNYGYNPIGASACSVTPQGCGYDSLNVALTAPPTTGSTPVSDSVYLNSLWGGAYCSGSTGTFRLDTVTPSCDWTGYQPAIRVEANAPLVGPPASKNQCKKDGWKTFNNPSFKNQGDCVSFVSTAGRNPANGPSY